MKRKGRAFAGVAAAGVFAAVLLMAGPRPIGPATYVVVARGQSMQPRFHVGDLVTVRASEVYGVGDVVAFHSDYNRVVLHRIIKIDDGRFQTRGDNNNFTDPYEPPASAVIGKLWWSIPKVGRYVSALRQPHVAAIAVAMLLALALMGSGARRRRRRRGEPERSSFELDTETQRRSQLPWGPAAAVAAIVACVLGAIAGVGWMRPVRTPGSADTHETAAFAYRAPTTAGSIFGRGGALTGQPIFFKTSKTLSTSFTFRFASDAPHAVDGDITVRAILSASDGWSKELPVAAQGSFTGDGATVNGIVSLARIQALIAGLESSAGVANGPYALDLSALVAVRGTVATRPYADTFAPSVRFHVDQFQIQVDQANVPPGSSPFIASHDGSVVVPGARENSIKFLRWRASVRAVRRDASAGAVAIGFLALLLFALTTPWRTRDEIETIERKYAGALIPVRTAPNGAAIDVESFDVLIRVAEHDEQMILHHRDGQAFYVRDAGTTYRYRIPVALRRIEYEAPTVTPTPVVILHDATRESGVL